MTRSPLVLAIVPATSASSTIDSLLSLSLTSSSGIIGSIMHRSTFRASERLLRQHELSERSPCCRLLLEFPGVRCARGRQVNEGDLRERIADQPPAARSRGRSVEGDRSKIREVLEQMLDPVVLCL